MLSTIFGSRARQCSIALLIPFLQAGVPTGAQPASQQITVRFLDPRSGKPIRKYPVVVIKWNSGAGAKDWQPLTKYVTSSLTARTDANGVVVVNVDPLAKFITVDFYDLAGGGTHRIDLGEVVKEGLTLKFDEKAGAWRTEHTARPGELLILTRKLTLWERMRRELP